MAEPFSQSDLETHSSDKSSNAAVDGKKAPDVKRKFQSDTDVLKSQEASLKKSEVEETAKRLKLETPETSSKNHMMSSKNRGPTDSDSSFVLTPAECPIESIESIDDDDDDEEDSDDGNNYAILSENGGWQIIPPR